MADHPPTQVSSGARDTSVALVLGAGTSLMLGSALVMSFFDEVGELGALFLRLPFAAFILGLVW